MKEDHIAGNLGVGQDQEVETEKGLKGQGQKSVEDGQGLEIEDLDPETENAPDQKTERKEKDQDHETERDPDHEKDEGKINGHGQGTEAIETESHVRSLRVEIAVLLKENMEREPSGLRMNLLTRKKNRRG